MNGEFSLLRTASAVASIAAMAWLASSTSASAECGGLPLVNMVWCNNCKVDGALTTGRDQACERPFRPKVSDLTDFQLLAARISQRAKHGTAGSNLSSFAYAPAKGYVGRDDFTVEVSYRQGKEAGKVYVHFDVTVQ